MGGHILHPLQSLCSLLVVSQGQGIGHNGQSVGHVFDLLQPADDEIQGVADGSLYVHLATLQALRVLQTHKQRSCGVFHVKYMVPYRNALAGHDSSDCQAATLLCKFTQSRFFSRVKLAAN